MARRKKGEAKPAEAKPGHNKPPLTEDEQRVLIYAHKAAWSKAQADVDAAVAERKRVEAKAKSELGKSAVQDIKDLILLDHPKGEAAMRADIERQLRLARWANSQIGTQFTFDAFDATPAVDRAHAEGKTAGLKGEVKKPPYDPSVPQFNAWSDGWNEGQAVLVSNFREKLAGGGSQSDLAEREDLPPEGQPNMTDVSAPPFNMPDTPMPEAPAQI